MVAWVYRSEVNEALLQIYPDFAFHADVVVMQIGARGEVIGLNGRRNKLLALSALKKRVVFSNHIFNEINLPT